MSAAPKILEGTWEEILQHAPELAGHRLQVTLLDRDVTRSDSAPSASTPPAPGSPEAVIQWINELRAQSANQPPLGPWDDSRDTIYEHLLK